MINKKNIIICGMCNTKINLEESYIRVTDFRKEKVIDSEGFYHKKCFQDRLNQFKESNMLMKKADWLLNKAAERIV